ncbi:MAG: glycosyltransferase [Xanthobacteraceae bacterium]|nr:glycosyltransferase [Xanthobacteraceae bacterium]
MTAPTCLPLARLPADAAPPDVALFLPTLYSGGAERVQINLAEYFLAQGLTVDFVVCKYYGSLKDKVPSGARLVSLDASRVMFSLPAYLRYLRAARPAVVLSSVENANIIACFGKMVSSHRHRLLVRLDNSLTEPGSLPMRIRRLFWTTVTAATFHAADEFVAVSDGLKRQLARLPGVGSKPIHRIYNPIIHEGFDAHAGERPVLPSSIGPGERFVLAVGRLHEQKGYKTLLPAFARAVRRQPAHLVILGEGDDRAELEALAASLGIASHVHFLGYAANPLAYMRHAAVFVLSSVAEGFGNVLVEALACGAPVVSTDCPHGPGEILAQGRYGTLVPTGDADALGDAIAATLSHPRPAMSAALKEHLQLFSIETIGRQYISKLDLHASRARPSGHAQVAAA